MTKSDADPARGRDMFGQAIDAISAVIRPWASALLVVLTGVLVMMTLNTTLLGFVLIRGHAAAVPAST